MAADQTTTWALDLQSNLAGVAKGDAAALEQLQEKIQGDIGALRGMQSAMRNLQGSSSVDIATFRKLKDQIAAQKATIASNQASYVQLGGTFARARKSTADTGASMQALASQIGRVNPTLGKLAGGLNAMKGSAMIAATGTLVLAAAVVVLTTAIVGAVAALAKYGIAQADARRSELLRLEGMTKLRRGFMGMWNLPPGNAAEMQHNIDAVSSSVAISRNEVAQYSNELYRMGLRGGNLQAALEGVSTAASAQGEAGAAQFKAMAGMVLMTGGSVRKLADDTKARLGGIVARQMLSLPVLAQKVRESFDMMFSDLHLEGFLAGLKSITDLFSQQHASGRALKGMIERLLQSLVNGFTAAAPIVKRFFQGAIIGALLFENMVLRLRILFRRTFGDVSLFRGVNWARMALLLGVAAARAFMTAIGAIGLVAGIAVVQIARLVDMLERLHDLFTRGAGAGRTAGADMGAAIGKSVSESAGYGVREGTPAALKAVDDLASQMHARFKDALEMHSPSRLFRGSGIQIAAGVAAGVEAGEPRVNASIEHMIRIPRTPPAAAKPATPRTLSIGELHIHSATDDPRGFARALRQELAALLETNEVQAGAA